MNDQGAVVVLDNAAGANYLYSGGVCKPLPAPSGTSYMQVLALNNAGAFAGIYDLSGDPVTYAFIAEPIAAAVPALSPWLLAVLGILLAGTGVLLLATKGHRTAV